MTTKARFDQPDIKKAVAGALAASLQIAQVEIEPNGRIVTVPGDPQPTSRKTGWEDLE